MGMSRFHEPRDSDGTFKARKFGIDTMISRLDLLAGFGRLEPKQKIGANVMILSDLIPELESIVDSEGDYDLVIGAQKYALAAGRR